MCAQISFLNNKPRGRLSQAAATGFERAHGGTLLLEELPLLVQGKILLVPAERTFGDVTGAEDVREAALPSDSTMPPRRIPLPLASNSRDFSFPARSMAMASAP
jgi:hypothetical protein